MPGLVMNQHSAEDAVARDGQARSADDAAAAKVGKPFLNGGAVLPQRDGASSLPNGALANGIQHHQNGELTNRTVTSLDLPPEIHMQIQEELFDFPKLIQRAAQQCYSGLAKLLAEMADMPSTTDTNGPLLNGINGRLAVNGARREDNNPANNKKARLFEFTNSQQAIFSKLLIMAQWTPHMAEVRRLMDVEKWLRMREIDYEAGRKSMLDLSRQGRFYREPNPDIRTSLEILSTRKASWMPDLGFLPLEPLKPDEILKQFRDMNTILSIRINLHEELPRPMRKWSVKNGRATFVVPGEFELDVSTTDDEPQTPYYFIDLRLLFSPAPQIPDGRLRDEVLDPQINTILSESGLAGGYNYLHNYCLTQKIMTLRKQAVRMSQGNWAGTIRVELVHRVLVVQYWTAMPGSKSWIEIGLSSGSRKKRSWRGPEPSYLSVRWMRNGKEVNDCKIDFDWTNLDMERMLLKILHLHAEHLFRSINDNLQAMAATGSTLSAKLHVLSNPSSCRLEVCQGNPNNRTDVVIDSLTGRFVLRPPGPAATTYENEINSLRNPAAEAHKKLARLLCVNLKTKNERCLEHSEWELVRNPPVKSDELRQAVGVDVLASSCFRGQGWTGRWLLVLTINLAGDSWWLIELKEDFADRKISFVRRVPVERFWSKSEPVSQVFVERLEQHVIEDIASFTTRRELSKRNIGHHSAIDASTNKTVEIVTVKTSDLLAAALPGVKLSSSWAAPIVRLCFDRSSIKEGQLFHTVKAKIAQPDEPNLGLIKSSPKDGVHFGENGSCTIVLRTSFGISCLPDLLSRLRSITRLTQFASVLKAVKVPRPLRYSLSQLEFLYAKPDATAVISFPEDASIGIHFKSNNPHQRVRKHLNNILSSNPSNGFRQVVESLISTLPLLRALGHIEQPTSEPPFNVAYPPSVHCRDITWYRIMYHAPNPICSFDVRMKFSREEPVWHINDTARMKPDDRPPREGSLQRIPELDQQLKELFKEHGDDWNGIRSGLVAGVNGVEAALKRLDDVVKSCRRVEDIKAAEEALQHQTQQPQPQPQPQSQSQSQSQPQSQSQSQPQPPAQQLKKPTQTQQRVQPPFQAPAVQARQQARPHQGNNNVIVLD